MAYEQFTLWIEYETPDKSDVMSSDWQYFSSYDAAISAADEFLEQAVAEGAAHEADEDGYLVAGVSVTDNYGEEVHWVHAQYYCRPDQPCLL